ncbi:MAG: SPOR domain-containing protein [Myxococcaceae bacterium]|nr:SPOR domain-containing protein [Myxococcaceae bacterium]
MRDAHRMKEKFDLSLDNRQIVSLLIGGLVVLGAVFVLGVVVGKKLAGNQTTAQAPDLLTALDRKAEDVPLTFQDVLTQKSPPLEVAAAPEPAPKAPPPAPKPAPPPPQEAVAEAKPQPAAEAPAPVAEAKAGPKDEEPAGVDAEAATLTATHDGGLKDAFARATSPKTAKPPAEAKTGGAYTLQLSASQSREEADRFAARLRDRGYAPFVIKAEVPGRGTWYRVRMGSFPTRDAATRYLNDFKRETQIEAFVATAN